KANKTSLFLKETISFFREGDSSNFIFGTKRMIPIKLIKPSNAINQKIKRQDNMPQINDPNGTPNINAIVKPPGTHDIANPCLVGETTFAATTIAAPKNEACIIPAVTLVASSKLNVGAIALPTLLTIKSIISIISNGFLGHLTVIIVKSGPNTATLMA